MALTMRVVPCELFEELMKMMTRRDEPKVIVQVDKAPVTVEEDVNVETEDDVPADVPVTDVAEPEVIKEAGMTVGETENTFQNWKNVSDVSTQTEIPLQKAGRRVVRKISKRNVNRKASKKIPNKTRRKR